MTSAIKYKSHKRVLFSLTSNVKRVRVSTLLFLPSIWLLHFHDKPVRLGSTCRLTKLLCVVTWWLDAQMAFLFLCLWYWERTLRPLDLINDHVYMFKNSLKSCKKVALSFFFSFLLQNLSELPVWAHEIHQLLENSWCEYLPHFTEHELKEQSHRLKVNCHCMLMMWCCLL